MGKSARGYLGRFRLLNVVHTGQNTQIWQAMDDGRQQKVAVKTPLDKFVKDAELIGCLRREFQIGKALPDPRVIEVFDFGIDRGVPYLATEWFTGPNLKKWIRSKEEREKIAHLVPKIIEDAAAALACLNRLGWVHRDIKPDNFLLHEDGRVKLIDFGLAQRAQGARVRRATCRPSKSVAGHWTSGQTFIASPAWSTS
jgi:serine/threonine protein kinase